jgi:biotin carboxyl carrier protein
MKVSVNEDQFEFTNLNPDELDIVKAQEGFYHILYNNKSFLTEVLSVDYVEKTFVIKVNGDTFSLKISDEYEQLVEKLGLSVNQEEVTTDIVAPMPGLILKILVSPGQEIIKGDHLLILEAMKMENVIKSEGAGVVKSIEIKEGVAVEKGQMLIVLE